MKHLLNNLSEEEKNAIREQHTGGMKVMVENFSKLANSKLGDVRTIVESTIKEDISNTPSKVDGGLPLQEQKSVLNSANLLDNKSETYNKQIGVKVLPDCFRYASDVQKAGIFPSEIDILVDKLDFPMGDRDVQHATQWSQGNGFPGIMGGEGNYGNLGKRVVNKDGLWYPAVEDLRVKYNLDESFEDLGSISKKKELVKFRNALLQAYQYWIDCMKPAMQSYRFQ